MRQNKQFCSCKECWSTFASIEKNLSYVDCQPHDTSLPPESSQSKFVPVAVSEASVCLMLSDGVLMKNVHTFCIV